MIVELYCKKQYVRSESNMVRYNPPNGKYISSQCIQAEKNESD